MAKEAITVAEERRRGILAAYAEWLACEKRAVLRELYSDGGGRDWTPANTFARPFHFPDHPHSWRDVPAPSTRMEAVMAAVGLAIPESVTEDGEDAGEEKRSA